MIWQDSAEDLFYFCDTSGNKIGNTPHFFNGTGLQPFSIRPTGAGSGNVLIGIRRSESDPDIDGYMWSWHIWITDYNPDNCLDYVSAGSSWTEESVTTDNVYDWNDGRLSGMKHLFDPAPIGWRLPVEEEIMDPKVFEMEPRYYVTDANKGTTAIIPGFFYKLRIGSSEETGEPEFCESFFPLSGVMRGDKEGTYITSWISKTDGGGFVLTKSNATEWKISYSKYGELSTIDKYMRLCFTTRMVRDISTRK